jgi:Ca2+-binding RTX toxin-like protein
MPNENVTSGQTTNDVHVFDPNQNRADFEIVDPASAVASVSSFVDNFLSALPLSPRLFAYRRGDDVYQSYGLSANLSSTNRTTFFNNLIGVNNSAFTRQASRWMPGISVGGGITFLDNGETLSHFSLEISLPGILDRAMDSWKRGLTVSGSSPSPDIEITGALKLLVTESFNTSSNYSPIDGSHTIGGEFIITIPGGGSFTVGFEYESSTRTIAAPSNGEIVGIDATYNELRIVSGQEALQAAGLKLPELGLGNSFEVSEYGSRRDAEFVRMQDGRILIGDHDATAEFADKFNVDLLSNTLNESQFGDIIIVTGRPYTRSTDEVFYSKDGTTQFHRSTGRVDRTDPITGSRTITLRANNPGEVSGMIAIDANGERAGSFLISSPDGDRNVEVNEGALLVDGVVQGDESKDLFLKYIDLTENTSKNKSLDTPIFRSNGDTHELVIERFGRKRHQIVNGDEVLIYEEDGNYEVFTKNGNTDIRIKNNPLSLDFSDVGGILGQQLGYRLAGGNIVLGIGASALLQTLGNNIGDALDEIIGGGSPTYAVGDAFRSFDSELLTNLKSAGIGAISSFLTAQLVHVLGVDGFAGEALNTGAGVLIGEIVTNIFAGAANPFAGIGSTASLAGAAASFLGTKLANEIYTFETIGGQIGAAVGTAALGIVAATTAVWESTLIVAAFSNPATAVLAVAAFAVAALVGGLIGSVFGGTPRSGADAAWNEAEGRFGVANAYARKGGSKDAAMSMADTVAQTFNAVLDATGGRLENPGAVTTGNYGMRKSDYVYRPSSTRDKDAITFRVSSKDKDGFAKITGHGIYQGLTDSDFQIVGGSNYVKRAVYATFEMGGVTASNFDSTVLLGNISSAQSYESYLANSAVINAIVAAERDSVFAVETAINLARAVELGLTKRHRSDWFGGFGALMNEAQSNSANVAFGFDYDPFSDQVSRLITVGEFVMGDSIDIAGQTTIEAGDGNDVIILAMVTHNTEGFAVTGGAGYLANTANLKINGVASTGGALTIDVAATIDAGGGDDVVHASNLGDNVFGGDGNDTLYGGRLDDWLLGGDGNDTLDAGTLDQAALGGDGNYLNGGDGNDVLRGREGSDWLDGGDGTDILTGGAGDDVLAGGAGAGDSVKGGTGDDQYLVRRGDGEDLAEDEVSGMPAGIGAGDAVSQRYAGIAAGSIKKNWAGSSAAIQQQKLAGGEDAMVFGQGIDIGDIQLVRSTTAGGGAGNDLIVRIMQTDPETGLEGYSGTSLTVKDWFTNPFKRIEWLKFADGNEIRIGDITSFIIGGDGDDVLIGTQGNDFVYGGPGNDKLFLLAGDDIGNGGSGDDIVLGDAGRDLVIGGTGADELVGGAGSDAISGDDGADDIYGGNERDVLSGGRGDGDQVVGGGGDDTFKFSRGDGKDTYFDDFSNNWDVVWSASGEWNATAGYSHNATTGEVTGPGGIPIRKNVGTVDEPDFRWIGRFDYDGVTQTFKMFNPPAGSVTTVSNNGVDTIEFAPGINLQDVILRRTGNDLVMAVSNDELEVSDSSKVADSVTIKDWYVTPGGIEKVAFYETGILDISSGVTNLVAGTDGADGTTISPLAGTTLADWITGGAGDDVVAGGAGKDILAGNSGSDTLRGEADDDVLYGGTGNDVLDGGAGKDVLVGGNGIDTVSYASSTGATRVRLSFESNNTANALGDEFHSIENVIGGSAADNIGGDAFDNELDGAGGDDILIGGASDDTYIWNTDSGADTIREGAFVVEEAVTAAGTLEPGYTTTWTNTGTPSSGGKFYWRLQVHNAANELVYDLANYSYASNTPVPAPTAWNIAGWLGGFTRTNGNQVTRDKFETSISGGENDVVEFGSGISLSNLTFIRASSGIADPNGSDLIVRYNDATAAQITISNHFTVYGGVETLQFQDGLAVSLASILSAGSSADFSGTASDDLIVGQAGALNDVLYGGAGNDVLSGMAGVDQLHGEDGDDVIEGGADADFIDGGAGTAGGIGDTVRYVNSAAVNVDLRVNTAQSGGDAAGDTLQGIENVVGSRLGNDIITGDANANRIDALDGDNIIHGHDGDDVLISGSGADAIHGDIGDDNISSGDGNDALWGGEGRDILFAGTGDDQLRGEAGNDRLLGGEGNDTVLDGGIGDDEIYGGEGNDSLTGGDGKDTLGGGTGNDSLQGGLGDDIYFVQSNDGNDTIIDANGVNVISFDSAITHDRIWLSQAGSDLRIGVVGENTVLTVTGFFAGTTPSLIKSIQTSTHAIYLDHPDTLNLIAAMTASSVATPGSVPGTVATMQARHWHAGGKAKPIAPASARSISTAEDGAVAVDGTYGIIDHDNNVNGFALKSDSAPTKGTISAFNADTGAFIYTPNANVNGTDNFVVVVTDADGNATEIPVAVTISAVNDAPGSIDVKNAVTLSVIESTSQATLVAGTIIAEFVATDPEGDAFIYSLVNQANVPFALSVDGQLTIADPSNINFESTSSHTLRVRVTDAQGASSIQDFVVDVQNANEGNGLPTSYAMTIGENAAIGTVVGTVAASDIDTSGTFSEQHYYFWDGNAASGISDDSQYSIDAITGQITVNSALDFEGPNGLKTYSVIARDNAGRAGYNQVMTTVTVGISDVNEANSLPANYDMVVAENVAVGTIIGSVAATDTDNPGSVFAQQRYYFWDGNAASQISSDGRYAIDQITGAIATNSALNFESGSTLGTYAVIARDNAGNAGFSQVQTAVTIGVSDANELNSIPASYTMSINENVAFGALVGIVAATDVDQSGVFAEQRFYFWDGGNASATSSDGRYAINAVTGEITVNAALNYEAGLPSQTYLVIARDNGGNAGFNQVQSEVTIGINDVNEAPISLNWAPLVVNVDERDRVATGTAKPAIDLGILSVTDPDTAGSPDATYTYTLNDSRFEIVGGVLRLRQDAAFDFEAGAIVTVRVTGTDQTGAPFTINRLIDLAVNDLDDILEGGVNGDVLTGQSGRDIITGNGGDDQILGLSGNDSLEGGDGADRIHGDEGDDSILGQAGVDILNGGAGADTLLGGTEDDILSGDADNDSLFGGAGSEGIRAAGAESWRGFAVAGLSGGTGDDVLDGGDGDDYLDGGAGADQLIGGAGFDGADYTGSSGAVNVNLATGLASGGAAQGDTLSGIELVQGSGYGDTITGSANADVIYGGIGDDIIFGGAGNDYLFGGAGNDIIDAQAGDDMLDGGAGDDILNGGLDNDVYVLTRSSGADTINNYDPSGDDIDVIGFNDIMGAINDQDLWFEKLGNDLKITVIGTGSSVQVANWYTVTDPASRANHKIDFIIANTSYSRTINVEGLVNIMATKAKPTSPAQRDALMADLTYKATWATYWNTNEAPVLGAIPQQSTNEDAARLFSVTATDDITPNAQVALSAEVISGTNVVTNAGINFGAANASGVRTMTINPVSNASGTARIRLIATDAGGVTFLQEFDIVVNGVADTPTITSFSSPGGTSGYPAGIPLALNVSFPDADGSETQEIWIAGVPSGVTLSAGIYDSGNASWKLTSAQLANLKVLAPAGWSSDLNLSVSARATENGQTAISTVVNTTVVINAPPTGATFSGSVNENAVNGAAIANVVGIDPDAGDVLTYSLISTAGGRFAISTTGALSVANGTLLNFETLTSHSITVRIADARGEFIDRGFSIGVNNANEANSVPSSYSFGVNENASIGTLIGTIAATDLDSSGTAFGQQRYYFWNGTTASTFSSDNRYAINETTGQITSFGALNFEAGSSSVAYTVIARDNQGATGFNQVQSSVNIGIANVNEANSLPSSYSFGVAENVGIGTNVGTVAATDQDGSAVAFGQQRYYFWNGSTASAISSDNRFSINATTGQITSNGALNFEAGSPSVAYTVIARDNQGAAGYNQVQSSVTIGITNVNEANSVPSSYSFAVAESASAGALVGTVAATDQDSSSVAIGQQRYYFWNGSTTSATSSDGRYAINATTGQITRSGALNFEAGSPSVAYTVIARDNQGAAGYNQVQSSVTIGITDVNEANSVPSSYSFGVNENASFGTLVGTVAATDQDSPAAAFGQQRYYFWNGSTTSATSNDGRYAINATTGQITRSGALNFEAGSPSVAYTVIARDNQGAAGYNQVQSSVTIGVINVNEANSLPSSYSFGVVENAGIGTSVGTVAATDQDSSAAAFGQQRYFFWNGSTASATSSDGRYAINATSGQITSNSALNYEAGSPSVAYTVIARDNNGAAGYTQSQSSVTIGIQDLNEIHSLTARSGAITEGNAPEPFYTQFNLHTMMLADPESRVMQWTFADGTNVSGIWTLSPSGQLSLTANGVDYEALTTRYDTYTEYDWETGETYEYQLAVRDYSLATQALQVRAYDGNHSVVSTFTASVTDKNEGSYLASTKQYYVNDDQGEGLFGNAIYAIDPDTGSSAVSIAIDYGSVTLTESNISSGSSSDVDNTGNPYVYLSGGNRLAFSIPGDGEWEGGISNHPTLGGRRYYQLDYSFDLILTDPTGVQSRERINVTFRKHGTSGVPPIILDLDGDGIELTDFEGSPVYFDMDLDGVRDQTGWVGSDDGFLALDRNSNGTIDNVSEISFVSDVEGAQSDLEGLRAYDTDNNGYFDEGDSQFADFLIWKDTNLDGISQAGELQSLGYWGITAINLSLTLTGEQPSAEGNVLFATSDYEKADGTSALVGDVFLGFTPSNISGIAAPVIFDFDGDSAALIKAADSEVRFDMDGDGRRDRTGWIEAGDAFLALDRNGNGLIDDISEISFLADTPGAKTDLEGLASFDTNGDGQLTSQDNRFAEFKLWFDANTNGVTDAGELLSLAEATVSGLSLQTTAVSPGDLSEQPNIIYNRSQFTRSDGSTGVALDAGIAYQRLGLDGASQTAISGQSGSVAGADSNSDAPILPSIAMEKRGFQHKAKKYLVDVRDGGLFIADRKANGTVDPRAGIVGGASILSFKNTHIGMLSPVILDLDGDGLEVKSRKKSKARFDMDGDGVADDTGWVGKGDGMLVIDRNNDGRITGASEISFLTEKADARSDLEALAVLDSNKDGKLSASDTRFGELKIWIDGNQNGVSDDGELTTLAEFAITEISLVGRANAQKAKIGDNVILATSTFKRTDGSIGSVGDVALAFDPSSKHAADNSRIAVDADAFTRGDDQLVRDRQIPLTLPVDSTFDDNGIGTLSNDVTNELLAVLKTSRNRSAGNNAERNPDLQPNYDLAEMVAHNFGHRETGHPRHIANSVEAVGFDDRKLVSNAGAGSVPIDTDRLLALITQDMAAFGKRSGANDNLWRRDNSARPAEFFA